MLTHTEVAGGWSAADPAPSRLSGAFVSSGEGVAVHLRACRGCPARFGTDQLSRVVRRPDSQRTLASESGRHWRLSIGLSRFGRSASFRRARLSVKGGAAGAFDCRGRGTRSCDISVWVEALVGAAGQRLSSQSGAAASPRSARSWFVVYSVSGPSGAGLWGYRSSFKGSGPVSGDSRRCGSTCR